MIYREVGYTVDRRVAAEGGVAAVMIVEMQPVGKRGGAGRLAAVDAVLMLLSVVKRARGEAGSGRARGRRSA